MNNGMCPQNSSEQDKEVELKKVAAIRTFFEEKIKYHKGDSLSQAYISSQFEESDITDKIEIEPKLSLEDLSLEDLRSMFIAYCHSPDFLPSLRCPKDSWKIWDKGVRDNWSETNDRKVGQILRLKAWNVIKQAAVGGSLIGVIVSAINYGFSLGGLERQKYFQAWQVINTAQGYDGNGGRIEALQYLKSDGNWFYSTKCQKDSSCLVGIEIKGSANLEGIDLSGANLNSSILQHINLKNANLKNANLEGAHLENSNLEGAKVDGIKYKNAKFCNTTMPDGIVRNDNCEGKKR
jgi:hypothetical protein